MKSVIYTAVASALLLTSLPGHAEGAFKEGLWHVSPMATYVFREDKDRLTNTGFGGHFGIGRALTDNWALELNLVGTSLDGLDETNQWGIGFDAIRAFGGNDRVHPYVVFGIGHMLSQNVEGANRGAARLTGDDDDTFASIGAGLMFNLGESNTLLRTDVRFRNEFADPNSFGDLLWNFGFQMPFGEASKPQVFDTDNDGVSDGTDRCPGTAQGAAVDVRGCELDSDRDGVVDSRDACPDTRSGARVDRRGCEVIADSDGDGVGDDKDQCANTPRGTKVDAIGCKMIGDGDKDGVMDNRDRCPNSAAGARVDTNGCEFKEELRLPGVEFELSSATLRSTSTNVLDNAATSLQRYPDVRVEAQGHTDSTGSDSLNMKLSQQRAEAVRNYLVSKGVAADRITARGYGETQPVSSNDTKEGRANNRRVTLRVIAE